MTGDSDIGGALRAAHARAQELLQQRRPADAEMIYARMRAVAPDQAWIAIEQGLVLLQGHDRMRTLRHFEEAARLFPDSEPAWQGLGKALYDVQRPEEAILAFSRAATLAKGPALARYHRGMARLMAGDFAAGWRDFENRLAVATFRHRHFDRPRWDGQSLGGRRLLVICEQGYGDVFQFVRYLPLIDERGGRVVFECPQDVTDLLAPSLPGVEIVPMTSRDAPSVPFDCYASLLSLPHLFGTTLESIPARVPYLSAPAPVRPDPADGLHVGVVWAGRATHPQDHQRSMHAEFLAPLATVNGAVLHSLQKDAGNWPTLSGLTPFLHPPPRKLERFSDTAAVLLGLDLVITVDTAVAHLAGALGRPVWLLLDYGNDWRWMLKREDTPWYPAMRLFRQKQPGDWPGVIAAVRAALEVRAAASAA